jgi:hypothetical protein
MVLKTAIKVIATFFKDAGYLCLITMDKYKKVQELFIK